MANPSPELGLEAYLQAMGVAHERQAHDVAALQSSVDEVARVRELLGRLPDKVRHKAMVPFGKHAFFEGELVHTNEFLVGLGCELQLEASAKQAAELLARRQGRAEAALARARLQLRELEARMQDLRMSLTNESGEEFMEIRQDWDEAEQLLRDAAASATSAKAGNGAPGRGSSGGAASSSGKGAGAAAGAGKEAEEADAEEARIFARLAELERLEAEAGSGGEDEDEVEAAEKGKTEEAGSKTPGKGGGVKGAAASTERVPPGQSMDSGAAGGAGPAKQGATAPTEPPVVAAASSDAAGPLGPAKVSVSATAAGKAGAASSLSATAAAGSGGPAPLRKGFLLGGGGAKPKAAKAAAAPATPAASGVASSSSAMATAATNQPPVAAAVGAAAASSPAAVSCARPSSSALQDTGAGGSGSGGSGSTSPSASEARRRRRVSFADGSAPGEEGGGDAEMLAAGPFTRRSGSPSDGAVAPSSGAAAVGLRPALKQGTASVPAASQQQAQEQQQRQQQQQPSAEEFWGPVAARGRGVGLGASGAAPVALFEESACDAAMAMARAREQAFSGQVVERDGGSVAATSPASDGREEAPSVVVPAPRRVGMDYGVPPEEPEPPKRMSKFKQQRAGLA